MEVVLEHLLLAPKEFLAPRFLFLPFGFSALSVRPHFLEHRVQLSVPLDGIGLGLFPSRSRRFLPRACFLLQRRCPLGTRGGPLRDLGAFGDYGRQFLPVHKRDCARRKRACGTQIGEILQPVSVNCVTLRLEAVSRDDLEVRRLYADFVREADGPLVYDREEAGVDLDEEIVKGPPEDLVPPNGVLLLARVDAEAAGLGGVRYLDTEIAEVKSMYVTPAFRGTGLGKQILARLDEIALEHGCRAVRLDTSDYLTPAVGLYRSAGYREVAVYNENPKADLWFERALRQDD